MLKYTDLKLSINKYYDQCHVDYQLIWRVERTLGLHMGYYDDNITNHSQAVLRMNMALADTVNIRPTDKVLDAGCGIGGSTIWLAKKVGCQVTGININPKQIQKAVSLSQALPQVSFCQADYCHTDFEANSFDVFWALESSCHAANKGDFLKEAYRVLKPGGRLIIGDYFVKEGTPVSTIQQWLDGWAVPDFASLSQFTKGLAEAGFSNVNVRDITKHVYPSSYRLYRFGKILYPGAKLLGALHIRSKQQTANVVAAIVQHEALIKGLWQYGLVSAVKDY